MVALRPQVLLDQFFLAPADAYGGDLARLPARADIGGALARAKFALDRFRA